MEKFCTWQSGYGMRVWFSSTFTDIECLISCNRFRTEEIPQQIQFNSARIHIADNTKQWGGRSQTNWTPLVSFSPKVADKKHARSSFAPVFNFIRFMHLILTYTLFCGLGCGQFLPLILSNPCSDTQQMLHLAKLIRVRQNTDDFIAISWENKAHNLTWKWSCYYRKTEEITCSTHDCLWLPLFGLSILGYMVVWKRSRSTCRCKKRLIPSWQLVFRWLYINENIIVNIKLDFCSLTPPRSYTL